MRIIVLTLIMTFLMPIIVVAESARDQAWKQDVFNEMTPKEYLVEGANQLIAAGIASELAVQIIICRFNESKILFMAMSRQDIEKAILGDDPYSVGRTLGIEADKRCAIKIK